MFWSASQSPGYWNSAASLWPELSLLLKLCLQHGMTANVQPANAPKHHRYDRLAADYRLWSLVAYTASLLLTKSLLVVYASLETSYREQWVYLGFASQLTAIKAKQQPGAATQIAD